MTFGAIYAQHVNIWQHMNKRGRADDVGMDSRAMLKKDMTAYVKKHSDNLWCFGVYAKVAVTLKNAPILEELVMNFDLWVILLRYFPSSKFKDKPFKECMHTIIKTTRSNNRFQECGQF